jgi:xanthosine utilization system XapX-like protein
MNFVLNSIQTLSEIILALINTAICASLIVFMLAVLGSFIGKVVDATVQKLLDFQYKRAINKVRIQQAEITMLGTVTSKDAKIE